MNTWPRAFVVFCLAIGQTILAEATEPTRDNHARRNCVVVTPHGPQDGGDFGPHTPGSKTSGLQEAFNAAKEQAKDIYLSGGSWTESKTQPVVYFLSETLHIPWMQNFRCDSGNCVIHYSPTQGDAVVIDSQMSCTYHFGLIVSMSSGATVCLKPTTAGPDRFKVITSTDFHFNALVGGGGAWPSGEAYNSTLDKKRKWIGTGLLLDASLGPIDANHIYVTEVVGCERGVHLTGACTHNAIELTSIHLSQTHLQLGDESPTPIPVRANRILAHMEAQGIEGATGALIHGADNLLTLSAEGMATNRDVVFGPHAENNVVTMATLAGFTDEAQASTNRIRTASSAHRLTVTPPLPPSGVELVNRHPWPVAIRIVAPGKVNRWTEFSPANQPLVFEGPLAKGQCILLNPGERLSFDYSAEPAWHWKALQ